MGNGLKTAARVHVLYTGGTFGMTPGPASPGHPLAPMDLDELRAVLPDARRLFPRGDAVQLTVEGFDRLIDSSSMTPRNWVSLARRIEDAYDAYDGFVVIHGTDTLAYTASALSFMLENLAKPVVITGSQWPLMAPHTDARENFSQAVQLAAYPATGLPCIPEVVVAFAGRVLRGCRARKMSATARAAFDTPNNPLLGTVAGGRGLRIWTDRLRPPPSPGAAFRVDARLGAQVLDITLYPGLCAGQLRRMLAFDDVRGVVLRSYGLGNAPRDAEFLSALGAATESGKVVVNVSQCPQGVVRMGDYAASAGLIDIGVISGLDMTPEAALTKLMTALGRYPEGRNARQRIQSYMLTDQRGEQSQTVPETAMAAKV